MVCSLQTYKQQSVKFSEKFTKKRINPTSCYALFSERNKKVKDPISIGSYRYNYFVGAFIKRKNSLSDLSNIILL
ncbi:hypothetical protein D1104_05955 [Actinobacillus pleuropneumoniae serovar 11 str. 56153]|nr:hypothetical protein D1104_05955 [Actinobacillus pleuropneumoniae serovar 11 str. 56153]UKH35048.1 hypothetical protein D1102_05925 [Actinobacillus pleuropneumoniae serovar 9 str. CVJ13261]